MKYLGRNTSKQNNERFYITYSDEDLPVMENKFTHVYFKTNEEATKALLTMHSEEDCYYTNANYDPTL